jgi:release factor glutamine methyltransferase
MADPDMAGETNPTLQQALQAGQALGLDRLDAQLLMLLALQRPDTDRAWLLAHDGDLLAAEAGADFRQLSLRRLAGEPVAYLSGHKEFFGLDLQVDARVLVPRPDTETLVNWSLDVIGQLDPSTAPDILDLGTGSGAIALALAASLAGREPKARLLAVDASPDALAVAETNVARLNLEVDFLQSHWLDKVSGHFHLIASNPPYIAEGDAHLAALRHEPLQALVAGPDGLADIRQIVQQAPKRLHPGGWLLLEHGHDQAGAVAVLLRAGGFQEVQHRQDLAGILRCTGGRWPGL